MKEEEAELCDDKIQASWFVRKEEYDKNLHDIMNIVINTILK